MEDLIHDCEGTDAYSTFGTSMEDDGFYDTPDFTQLVVDQSITILSNGQWWCRVG